MDANDIRLGTKFELEVPEIGANGDENKKSYVSQLLDIIDSKTISIAAPMYENRLKFLSNGLKIDIFFLNERQELLCFSAIVLDYQKRDHLETFLVKIQGEFQKIQRRRFFRLDITLEQQYSVLDTPVNSRLEFGDKKGRAIKKAFVKNISGSGACLILDEEPDRDKILDVTISLNEATSIRALAKIIRIIKNEKRFEVGVHFIKIFPHDSDMLMKFIFEQQRLLLKNSKQR